MYLGVDLGGTNIKVGLFDDQFQQIAEKRRPTESETNSDNVVANVKEAMHEVLDAHSEAQITTIGMGIPGLMDVDQGISKFSPNFANWRDVPVKQIFEQEFKRPVFIDNDVRVNLYGEWQFGAGQGKQNILMVTIGTGLGSGIVVDGHALYGITGSTGELGHMNMYRHGRPCNCGSSGCLGRYVSGRGIVKTIQEKLTAGQSSIINEWVKGDLSQIEASMLSDAYDAGDQLAKNVYQETGELLGFGLSTAINLLNPEVVIIGGGVANAGERLLEPTRKAIEQHSLEISRKACQIDLARLGDSAGMLGAAVMANRRMDSND